MNKGVQEDGNSKYSEKNRLFKRDLEAGKLYTERFVKKLKASHNKVLKKFTAGSNYAMRAMKRQIMARASRLVIDSHRKVLDAFQTETLCLLD